MNSLNSSLNSDNKTPAFDPIKPTSKMSRLKSLIGFHKSDKKIEDQSTKVDKIVSGSIKKSPSEEKLLANVDSSRLGPVEENINKRFKDAFKERGYSYNVSVRDLRSMNREVSSQAIKLPKSEKLTMLVNNLKAEQQKIVADLEEFTESYLEKRGYRSDIIPNSTDFHWHQKVTEEQYKQLTMNKEILTSLANGQDQEFNTQVKQKADEGYKRLEDSFQKLEDFFYNTTRLNRSATKEQVEAHLSIHPKDTEEERILKQNLQDAYKDMEYVNKMKDLEKPGNQGGFSQVVPFSGIMMTYVLLNKNDHENLILDFENEKGKQDQRIKDAQNELESLFKHIETKNQAFANITKNNRLKKKETIADKKSIDDKVNNIKNDLDLPAVFSTEETLKYVDKKKKSNLYQQYINILNFFK